MHTTASVNQASSKRTLFDEVGGLPILQKVHKIFYDKVYAHPWLKQFFAGHNQQIIEDRQTAFMGGKMGGPIEYLGKTLKMAHRHMYITEELFELRRQLLIDSLCEAGVPAPLRERWLKIDSAFKRMIVKKSIADFYHYTWNYQKRLIILKPNA